MATYTSNSHRGYTLRLVTTPSAGNPATNTTSVAWTLSLISTSYSFNGAVQSGYLNINGERVWTSGSSQSMGFNQTKTLASGTTNVVHNSDGTKSLPLLASFSANSGGYGPIGLSIKTNQVLETIPRKSQPTLNQNIQDLGQPITITTNRASSAFTHTLTYKLGTQTGTIKTGVGSSYTWELPNSLANAMPNSISGNLQIICTTYHNSNNLGTNSTYLTVLIPETADFEPSISSLTISQGTTMPSGITEFVQSRSSLKVVFSGSGKFGATIKSYKVIIDGTTYHGSNITSNIINKSGTISITAFVTDSRGWSVTISDTVIFVPYYIPRINSLLAERGPTEDGMDLEASIDLQIAPVSNQNAKHFRLRYRPSGGSWVNIVDTTGLYSRVYDYRVVGVLDVDSSYEVELYVADSWTSTTRLLTIGSGSTLMNFNASGKGIAIGKVSESDSFEVGMATKFYKGIGILDTRSIIPKPQDIPDKAMSLDFKFNTSVGSPPVTASTQYSHIINVAGWSSSEPSGGWPTQISVGANGFAVRQATSATAWGAWKSITNSSSSSRDIKKDIESTNHQENFDVFKDLKVYNYNLKDEYDEKKTREKDHIGLITDEVPDFLTDKDQSYIKVYELLSLTVSALQTTIKKVEALELKVKDLENENEKLKGGNQID